MLGDFRALAHYREVKDILRVLDQYRCSAACKEGGGTESCPIRKCCLERLLEDCWLCPEFEGCETLAWLMPLHGDAHIKNLRIIRDMGAQSFINGPKHW